jgi:hypothetical protein
MASRVVDSRHFMSIVDVGFLRWCDMSNVSIQIKGIDELIQQAWQSGRYEALTPADATGSLSPTGTNGTVSSAAHQQ